MMALIASTRERFNGNNHFMRFSAPLLQKKETPGLVFAFPYTHFFLQFLQLLSLSNQLSILMSCACITLHFRVQFVASLENNPVNSWKQYNLAKAPT